MYVNIPKKKIPIVLPIALVLLVVLAAFILSRPVKVPLTGQLRHADGLTVDDGFYDLRVVAFDKVTGNQTIHQDFHDVLVEDGKYVLPIELDRYGDTGVRLLQICRTNYPTVDKDGVNLDVPEGCKLPIEQQITYTYAECPQIMNIDESEGFARLIGERHASLFGECTYVSFAEQTGEQIPLAPSEATFPSAITFEPANLLIGANGEPGKDGLDGRDGQDGRDGVEGEPGPIGPEGPAGPAGDPASDDQSLSYIAGTQVLSISGGNLVSLSSLLDNTDTLADLSCSAGQVAQWHAASSTWVCGTASGVDTDDQTLSIDGSNNLIIVDGNSVSLAPYLDNTDAQDLSISGNILAISNDPNTDVDLSAYLDDTVLSEGQVEAFIFDGDNLGTLSSGTLALDLLSYSGTLGDAYVDDALTVSASGSVADGALSSNVSLFGASIESSEITDGTIGSDDLGANSVGVDEISTGAVTSDEILNGTILFADLATNGCTAGQIIEYNGTAWTCATDDAGTYSFNITDGTTTQSILDSNTLTFSDGTGIDVVVSATDTVTITALLGASIDSSEIIDGAITADDLGANSVGDDEINYSAVTLADFTNDAGFLTTETDGVIGNEILNVTANGGLARAGAGTGGDPYTVGLRTDCADNQILKWDTTGSAWGCEADVDTVDDADADATNELQNVFTIINAPNGTDPVSDANSDTLTLADGSGITITGDATTDTVTIAATLGTTIDSTEIDNGTILLADLNQNGCSSGQVIEWNGSAWVCGTDDTGGSVNSFETIAVTSGTDPVAESSTDTLTLTAGTGVTVTGDAGTDTITLAAVLGTDITSAEIVDNTITAEDIATGAITNDEILNGTILLADLGQNGCTDTQVMKWNNGAGAWQCAADAVDDADADASNELQNLYTTFNAPNGTDPVANSQTETLNFADGTNILITGTAGTDTINIGVINNPTFSGLVTLNGGLTIEAGDTFTFNGDPFTDLTGTGLQIVSGSLEAALGTSIDSTEIENSTILFADIGANGCSANEDLEYNGSAWVCGSASSEHSFGTVNAPNGTDPVADSVNDLLNLTNGNGVVITGTAGTDTVDVSLDVSTTGTTATTASNSGLEASATGLRLLGGCADGQILKWDATGSEWECGDLLAAGNNARHVYKSTDETVTNSTTLQNDDDLFFDIGANETWIYIGYTNVNGLTTADIHYDISVPTGTTCDTTYVAVTSTATVYGNLPCSTVTGEMPTTGDVDSNHNFYGTLDSGTTAGTVNLRWAQETAKTTGTIVKQGSWLQAYRVSGADLAEIFFADDYSIAATEIVALTGEGPSQIERGSLQNRDKAFGVVSTKPGQVLSEADGVGKPLEIGMAGRVPVKIKGPIEAGAYIQVSDTPGVGQAARTSGQVLGKALTPFHGEDEGVVMMLIEPGFWQAPVSFSLDSVVKNQGLDVIDVTQEADALQSLGLASIIDSRSTYSSFDQAAVDEFLRGFSNLQSQIDSINERLDSLEESEEPFADTAYIDATLDINSVAVAAEQGALVGDERFTNSVTFESSVYFESEVVFDGDHAGTAVIEAGTVSSEVYFSKELSGVPVVTITPGSFINGGYRFTNVSARGFTIELAGVQEDDVVFSWQALLTYSDP